MRQARGSRRELPSCRRRGPRLAIGLEAGPGRGGAPRGGGALRREEGGGTQGGGAAGRGEQALEIRFEHAAPLQVSPFLPRRRGFSSGIGASNRGALATPP